MNLQNQCGIAYFTWFWLLQKMKENRSSNNISLGMLECSQIDYQKSCTQL